MSAILDRARAIHGAQRVSWSRAWSQAQAEFENWRPTPTRAEADLASAGTIVMKKIWDLSPIYPGALDPTEPAGRPDDGRPFNTAPRSLPGLYCWWANR